MYEIYTYYLWAYTIIPVISFVVGVEYKNSHLQKVGCGANTPEQSDFLISLFFFAYVVVEG